MTKIDRITEVLNLADELKSATVTIEEMRGIKVEFKNEYGTLQILKADLDDSDIYYLWKEMPYEELINELKKHTI